MTADISILQRKSKKIITSYPKNPLSNKDAINDFLDNINKIRKPIIEATEIVEKIDNLLMELTWLDAENNEDENEVKEIINISKDFHKQIISDFAFLNKQLPKKMFGKALKNFKFAIDDFEESFYEAEKIFFTTRKNKQITTLVNSI